MRKPKSVRKWIVVAISAVALSLQMVAANAATATPTATATTVNGNTAVVAGKSLKAGTPVRVVIKAGTKTITLKATADTNGRFVVKTILPAGFTGRYSVIVSTQNSTTKPTTPTKAAGARNPLKQPFSSTSIWNTPIGSKAKYVPAKLSAIPGGDEWAPMPQIDDDILILDPKAPLTKVMHSDAARSGADRCAGDNKVLTQVPIPNGYVVPNSGSNNSAAILMADGRTIVQMQPFTRCAAGGHATSLLTFDKEDIYGDGISGAHGGSRMSAIGGTIRIGELRPGQAGPRHALKINVDSSVDLYNCSGDDCHRWPALTSDSGAESDYGSKNNNQNKAMKMGALLAIPPTVDIKSLGLQSEPGRQLAWTLQNYGAYIVDSTGGPAFAIEAETGPSGSVKDQFKKDYGYDLEARVRDNTPWSKDMQKIVVVLSVVDNNSASSVGGGGTPRQPLLPAIAPK